MNVKGGFRNISVELSNLNGNGNAITRSSPDFTYIDDGIPLTSSTGGRNRNTHGLFGLFTWNLFLQDEDVSHEMDIFIVKIGYNYIKIYMPFLKTSPSFCRSLWVSGHSKAHLENVITFGQGSVCRHVRIGIGRIVLEYRVGIIAVVISLTEI